MVLIPIGLAWVSYTALLYGYCLVRGYNVSLKQLVNPVHTYKWPQGGPPPAGNMVIFPAGTAASAKSEPLPGEAGTKQSKSQGVQPSMQAHVGNQVAVSKALDAFPSSWRKGGQYNALTHIIAAESGGNPLIANPSGAFGIAQALGHGTACSAAHNVTYTVSGGVGQRTGTVNEYGPQYGLTCKQAQAANAGDAYQQMRWMLGYVESKYGTPAKAWEFHLAHGWY